MTGGAEKFGLTWPGKAACVRSLDDAAAGTLEPMPSESVRFDTAENLVIEGDNLAVLKLLMPEYRGRIKMIYIDPPYNTRNRLDYADDRDHAEWLSLMYPRLCLAKALLRDDGVLFASIDDREMHHLRCILDEIFGEGNLCGVIKRRAARKPAFLSKTMSDVCDYVVAYRKAKLLQPLRAGRLSEVTRPVFNAGNRRSRRVVRAGTEARCPAGTYAAATYAARSLPFTLESALEVADAKTLADVAVLGPWRVNQDIVDRSAFVTRTFTFRRHVSSDERSCGKLAGDLLDDPAFYNERGSEHLQALLGIKAFDHPKPHQLIGYLAGACGVKAGDIVLDFFAGSGSTGEAIARRGDGSRFVLVQSAEPLRRRSARGAGDFVNVAQIARERLRRVETELQRTGGAVAGSGFKALRLSLPP